MKPQLLGSPGATRVIEESVYTGFHEGRCRASINKFRKQAFDIYRGPMTSTKLPFQPRWSLLVDFADDFRELSCRLESSCE